MDVIPVDFSGPSTNFDMEILKSVMSTDLLIRQIKEQAEETAILRNQVSSFNASAMQLKNCYTSEKKKNDNMERQNREFQLRIKSLDEMVSLLKNEVVNNATIHKQQIADLENQLADKATICMQVIAQGNVLKENQLSNKEFHQHYSNAKEFLRKRGVMVEDVKICSRKKKSVATMTEQLEPKEVKTFCDKSTMHSPMVTTATRGTTTSTFFKKVDAATNFPESVDVEVEEIFRLMIDNMPPALTPIDCQPTKTTSCQTTPALHSKRSVSTITALKNVRRKINYAGEQSQPSPTSNPLYGVKKEKEDSLSEFINFECARRGITANKEFNILWQMVGQLIFSIVGNGEVSNHSDDLNLMRDNLNEMLRGIRMEQRPQFESVDEHDVGSLDDFFNIAATNQHNNSTTRPTHFSSLHTREDPQNEQSSNLTLISKSPFVQHLPQIEQPNNSKTTSSSSDPGICLQPEQLIESIQLMKQNSSQLYEPIPPPACTNITALTTRSVQCVNETVFKKPTIAAAKRKFLDEDCTVRKRSCGTKMVATPKPSQLDKPNTLSVGETVDATDEQIEAQLKNPDPSYLDAILQYYKMPEFIEQITDPDIIVETIGKLDSFAEKLLDSDPPHSLPINSLSVQTASTHLRALTFDELQPPASSTPDFIEPDFQAPYFPAEYSPAPASLPTASLPPTCLPTISYDELESPASPPPFTDSGNHTPIVIPTSTMKFDSSVVKNILANFDERKKLSLSLRKHKVPSVEEEKILTSTRHRLERYIFSEWTDQEIASCCVDLSNIRPGILAKCLIEVAMNTNEECLTRDLTPPAPALPKSHQKLILLIKRIGWQVNRFEDLVLFQLEKTMFVLGGKHVSIAGALKLTHLFIGLADCMNDDSKWSLVLFFYKCLYYFAVKATPLVYSLLLAYPTILPKFVEGEDATGYLMTSSNILQATFVTILINTNLYEPQDSLQLNNGLRKKELCTLLKAFYNLPYGSITIDSFVDGLLSRLSNNSSNAQNINYALVLIAKRNGSKWANGMIQEKLMPLLNNLLSTISNGSENDERIIVLLSSISSIIKSFPVTDDISNYRQTFQKILDSTKRQTIQEEAVMALLRTSRFGVDDVYKRICVWEPSFTVDIDENLLERNKFKAEPLICDYLRERENQLQVDVYCGSIDTQNECLLNTDVVIGIEIIEHLYPDTIENMPNNIFGFMKPKIAIFTTPNAECNVLFNMTEKFRHDDHKFEWTREQFENWAYNICTRFPDYKVAFYGIGPGPSGSEHLGCSTQMALFVRDDFLELTSKDQNGDTGFFNNQYRLPEKIESKFESVDYVKNDESPNINVSGNDRASISEDVMIESITVDLAATHIDTVKYRLLQSSIYPRNADDRPREQKIFDEACFHISRHMRMDEEYYDQDSDTFQIPVKRIFDLIFKYTSDMNEFRYVMRKNNYVIDENDVFQIKQIESSDSEDEDEDEEDYFKSCPSEVFCGPPESEEDWD